MMHVETRGHGPDLVLLHGWAMHGGVLAALADALADDFRIHVVDLPGHGSSREETPGGLAITARRIAERIPPAIWLGWSLGGLVALRAALDVPQRVRGLVLIAASPRFVRGPDWPDGVPPEVFAQFAEGLDRDYRATIERFLALETLGSPHAQSELRELRAQVFARGEPAASVLHEGLATLDATDLRADLARLESPSLWIAGRRDRLVSPRAMRRAAELAPHARYLEINAGHAPFLGHADAVATAIREFVHEVVVP